MKAAGYYREYTVPLADRRGAVRRVSSEERVASSITPRTTTSRSLESNEQCRTSPLSHGVCTCRELALRRCTS